MKHLLASILRDVVKESSRRAMLWMSSLDVKVSIALPNDRDLVDFEAKVMAVGNERAYCHVVCSVGVRSRFSRR